MILFDQDQTKGITMALFGKGIDKPQTNDQLDADRRARESKWANEKAQDRADAKRHNPHLRTNEDIKNLRK